MASRLEAIAETFLQLVFHADNLTTSKFHEIETRLEAFALNFQTEVKRVEEFKFDPGWDHRVILVPKAIQNVRDLFDLVSAGLTKKIKALATPFKTFAEDVKLLGQSSSLTATDPGVSRLTTGFNDVQNFVTAVNLLVGEVSDAIETASQVQDIFDEILNDLEHLDLLFLQQGNSRKQTRNQSPRIRVGKLHKS